MHTRRIVITGIGAVTPLGHSVEESWENLLAGKSGITRVTQFDVTGQRCQVAGEIKNFDISAYMDVKEAHRLDPFAWYAFVAAEEAIRQSGFLESANFDPVRTGALIGSGIGGMHTTVEQTLNMHEHGPRVVSPLTVPMLISNIAGGYIAIRHNLQGPNFALASACASALHAIGEAYWIIQRNDADIMLCGGAEHAPIAIQQAAFSSMRALSTGFNDTPERASRPFDAARDGFVPAAGAGILVLEEEEHAKKRGATILAELVGYGLSCDAFHITAPREDGAGAAIAIQNAFKHAGISTDRLDYVNAHGTSTHLNDKMETAALKTVLGAKAYKTPVSSTKSQTGHMLGAAGGFESVVCVKAIQTGVIPGTMNYETPDPDCDLDYTPNQAREHRVDLALKTNFGFGGHNAAVLFARYA